MARTNAALNSFLVRLPLAGIGLFIGLFLLATYLYPGGSQANKLANGFSWMHNYWCNLLNEYAINGKPNPARPVALTAMAILCVSLAVFWYYLPLLFTFSRLGSLLVQLSGIGSMGVVMFIFTSYHDTIIPIASVVGFVALVGTFLGLYQSQLITFLWYGGVCLLLMAVNNYIYYTKHLLYYLPLVQKITFAAVLCWISLLTLAIQKKVVSREKAVGRDTKT